MKSETQVENKFLAKKVASAAIFTAVGVVLSYINPFAFFEIFETKPNPFAHLINATTGVLLGLGFSIITATSIALIRFSLGIGTIHAFHGGISGALIVGLFSSLLKKYYPERRELASFTEPIGTIFIGGTIAYFITPLGGLIQGLTFYWVLFALNAIPGAILGYLTLKVLRRAGITWKDFSN